jgi:hypothetical protein
MPKSLVLGAILALLSSAAFGQRSEIPKELVPDVQRAERVGASLFRAFQEPESSVLSPNLAKAKALADIVQLDRCNVPYRLVAIPQGDIASSSIYVFALGVPPLTTGVMGGRHYRIEVDPSGDNIMSVTPSTKTCLLISADPKALPAGAKAAAAYMTHLLSLSPTEFHVFLSLLHQKTIYVGTQVGVWAVEGGKISFVKSR